MIGCFTTCRPALEELDFFAVKTLRPDPGPLLGQVLLRDSVGGAGSEGVEEHGFYWSDDPSALENPSPATPRILFGPTKQNGVSDTAIFLPDAAKVYYFRAFAQRDERLMMAPQTQSFSLDLHINIEEKLTETDNDRMRVTARVQGLERLRAAVSEYGFVWSETNPLPDVLKDAILLQKGVLNRDDLFTDSLNGLIPGKIYYIRAFLKTGQRAFFSAPIPLKVSETWTPASKPFDGRGVWGSWATVAADRAFVGCGVGGGTPTNGLNSQAAGDERSDIWEFSTTDGQWSKWNIPAPANFNRFNALAFVIGNHLFVGTGGQNNTQISGELYQFDYTNRTFVQKIGNTPTGFSRMNAVSFVLNGKAYMGTGNTLFNNSPRLLDNFFTYEPATDTWDTIPPLPIFSDPARPETTGRRSAVAFVIDQRAYVTGGYRPNPADPAGISFDLLSDCAAYAPLLNQWLPMQPFPGEARSDAVAFVLDGKAYVGLGYGKNNGFLSDWWRFDPAAAKQWESVSVRFPVGRADAVAFALQNKGYTFGGRTVQPTPAGVYRGFVLNDGWMYQRN